MRIIVAAFLMASTVAPACAQMTDDLFPSPIASTEDVIRVSFTEFASIPDIEGEPARVMILVDEPGTRRMFINDMRGPLYTVSYDGRTVREYIDIDDSRWAVAVEAGRREVGFQSFALHPQFGEPGTGGYGRFYTWTDTRNTGSTPDFRPNGGDDTHDTILLEWIARSPGAATYDGGPPRELLRIEQPFRNHNAGQVGFNPLASLGDADFGLLYITLADGGRGGDPLNMAQDLTSPFGKMLRIDPLGSSAANGEYGVPAGNPFAGGGHGGALGEIYAYGLRNAQRFAWDPTNGNMFVSDIGQNIVEELSLVTAGANLGWNDWEGSFEFIGRSAVSLVNPRGDPTVTYPVAEYAQSDPLLTSRVAATGVHVYRSRTIPQLTDLVLWGDMPGGEIFYLQADDLPNGGQQSIRRVLLNDGGEAKTLLQLVQEKNVEQGKSPSARADLRFGSGPDEQVLILNKQDGVIRLLVPDGSP